MNNTHTELMEPYTTADIEFWVVGLQARGELSSCSAEKAIFNQMAKLLLRIKDRGVVVPAEVVRGTPSSLLHEGRYVVGVDNEGNSFRVPLGEAVKIMSEAFYVAKSHLEKKSRDLHSYGVSKKGEEKIKKEQELLEGAWAFISHLIKEYQDKSTVIASEA